jgi:hypothetical protein
MDKIQDDHGLENFAVHWLAHKGLDWAADILKTQQGDLLCAAE